MQFPKIETVTVEELLEAGSSYAVSLRGVSRYRCMPGAVDVHQSHIGYKIEIVKEWLKIKNGACLNYETLASSGLLYEIRHSPNIQITDEIKTQLDSAKIHSSIKFQLCWNNATFQMNSLQIVN